MRNTDKKSLVSLKKPLTLLVIAWAVVLFSLFVEISNGGNWLARSGSLMVLFSVISNYVLQRGRDIYHGKKLEQRREGNQPVDFLEIHPSRAHRSVEYATQVSIIIGTVIWGYGDLFLKP